MGRTKIDATERNEAIEHLRSRLTPGTTVYTIVTHVSRSGMARSLRVFSVFDGELREHTYRASVALGYRMKDGAIVVNGCGFDAGFEIVSNLSRALHGNESVGGEAIEMARQGRPFTPTADTYRAGYSLIHDRL